MKISLEHFSKLARLSLSEEEKVLFSNQIGKILDYMEKLNELDTEGIEPTSHIIALNNVVRDDVLQQSLDSEDILSNAPDRADKFYRVPRIIE
jgi:aspartyl-tRNA(Asn)/glutamyl-tRNA(Gln) amidotransferase subunit C